MNYRSLNQNLSLILIEHVDLTPNLQKTSTFELAVPKMKWSLCQEGIYFRIGIKSGEKIPSIKKEK